MLLSDGSRPGRLMGIAGGLALLVLVAGCQVRPLYSSAGDARGKLASVSVSEADDRVEQQVRNGLVFALSGGAGEPQAPSYHLDLDVTVRNVGVLLDIRTDVPRAGRIIATADYNLAKIDSGETVTSGRRSAVAPVDFPIQEFAKLRAVRDAENRAARELAEMIRAEIAAALAR